MRRPIVHIRSARPEGMAGGPVERLLGGLSPGVEVCGDVYRGLARLLRQEGGPPRAAVVCVEDLGHAEMEFFSIAARLLRDTPVYVYGDPRVAERVRRAIELGATGEATEEAIRRLGEGSDEATLDAARRGSAVQRSDEGNVETSKRQNVEISAAVDTPRGGMSAEGRLAAGGASSVRERPEARQAVGTQEPTERREVARDVAETATASPLASESPDGKARVAGRETREVPREPIREPDRTDSAQTRTTGDAPTYDGPGDDLSVSVSVEEPLPPSANEEDAKGGVGRVPWLRYGDRPVRKPPPRFENDEPGGVREARPRPASLRGPLLTEEELRALLGDDIASIAPERLDESNMGGSDEQERPS